MKEQEAYCESQWDHPAFTPDWLRPEFGLSLSLRAVFSSQEREEPMTERNDLRFSAKVNWHSSNILPEFRRCVHIPLQLECDIYDEWPVWVVL